MSNRETSDDYDRVVGTLAPKLRLIDDGMQWIVQERRASHWQNYWHCRTRAGLLVKYAGELINRLPERHL